MTGINLLKSVITWLENHKFLNGVLIIVYFLVQFFMHTHVVNLSVVIMNALSLPSYNKLVAAIAIVLAAICLFTVTSLIIKSNDARGIKIFYLLITFGFITLHALTMFEMNIEIIHVFQYGLFALILFPFTGRFGAAIFFTIPFMLVDEWNQYVRLYPGFVEYLELNDVIMDIYGCGLAMATLMAIGIKPKQPVPVFYKRIEFFTLITAGICLVILFATCIISLYPETSCGNTQLVLTKLANPLQFWRKFPNRDVVYHVASPLEAMAIITGLSLFYMTMDSWFRKPVTQLPIE